MTPTPTLALTRTTPAPGSLAAIALALALVSLLVGAPTIQAADGTTSAPDVTIVIGSGLSDREVTVDAGDVVAFVNRDGERHRMRARTEPEGFDTGNLEPGASYRVALTVGGTYDYLDERNEEVTAYHGRIVVRAPSSGGPEADAVTVRIGDEVFSPAAVTVAVGGTVTFENVDGDDHTATSTDGGPLASPVLATGAAYDVAFPEPGTFAYLCAIHPEMTGTVEVAGDAPEQASGTVPVAPAAPVAEPAEPTAPDGAIEIEMQDFAFAAPEVEVPTGTTVTWANTGSAPHTATGVDGSFDTTLVAATGRASHTFTTPGTYDYLCVFHPGMTGTIRVVGAAAQAPIASAPAQAGIPAEAETPTAVGTPAEIRTPGAATQPAAVDAAPASSTNADALARLVLVAVVVSVAAALFARVIQGTVRPAD